jgi:hypothetical protein
VSTLQMVIEGTSNYSATSTNALNNKKIQTFNFLGLVTAWDAAGRPTTFNIANNLATYRTGGSDTAMIGGAIAYQYARTGTLGTLTNGQMQAVINDPAFGVSAQSITPVVGLVALALDAPVIADGSASLRMAADTGTLDTVVLDATSDDAPQADGTLLIDQAAESAADHSALNVPPIPDSVVLPDPALEHAPVLAERLAPTPELLVAPTLLFAPELTAPASASTVGASHAASDSNSNANVNAAAHGGNVPAPTGSDHPGPGNASVNDPTQNDKPGAGVHQEDKTASDETDTLVAQWFDRSPKNDDLTQLDDILRGEETVSSASPGAIAAEWERSHQWLSRYANLRNGAGDSGADGADVSGLSYLGLDDNGFDMPRAVVGLRGVAGHELKAFRGLQEGVKVLGVV